jgi:hypothetical protein
LDEAVDAVAGLDHLIIGRGEAGADVPAAVLAEGEAGDHGDLVVLQ